MPYSAPYLVRQWIQISANLRRPWYSDPAIDSRPALFVPVYSALFGSTVDTSFVSVYGVFHIFYVNGGLRILRSILDSQECGHYFLPPVSGSQLFELFA